MSPAVWAGDTTLPLTSWRDGTHVYVSATPLPLTAAQAREAALRLLEHAEAIEQTDPHAAKVEALARWRALHTTGECPDCDNTPGCTCEIAKPLIGRAHVESGYPMPYPQQLDEAMNGWR